MMSEQSDVVRLAVDVTERDHARGPAGAPVTLVEYGDYECPYCGKAHPILKRIRKKMGDRLRFVFRNFPLNTIHEHASVAAQAAEAAGAQGKFWEMHNLLFEHQEDLAEADLAQYALKIGLEVYQFDKEMREEAYAKRVREDFRGGLRSGVNKTPTFFINGVRWDGPLEHDPLWRALEEAAGEKGG